MPECGPYCHFPSQHLTRAHYCPKCKREKGIFKLLHVMCCEKMGCTLNEEAQDAAEYYQCIECHRNQSERCSITAIDSFLKTFEASFQLSRDFLFEDDKLESSSCACNGGSSRYYRCVHRENQRVQSNGQYRNVWIHCQRQSKSGLCTKILHAECWLQYHEVLAIDIGGCLIPTCSKLCSQNGKNMPYKRKRKSLIVIRVIQREEIL